MSSDRRALSRTYVRSCGLAKLTHIPSFLSFSAQLNGTRATQGTYCDNKGYPYKLFNDWTQIKADVEKIISGQVQPKEIMTDLGKTTELKKAQQ